MTTTHRPSTAHPRFPRPRRLRAPMVLLWLVLLAIPVAAPASELPGWHSDLATAQAAAREEGKLLLVDFFATWCGWCKSLEREVFPSQEFRSATAEMVLLRLDIEDRGEGSRLARRFRIESVPAAVLVDGDLVEVGRIPGFSRAPGYVARIERELERHRELEQSFEQQQRLGDPDALLTLADELYRRGDGRRAGQLYQRLLEGWQGPSRPELLYRLADSHRLAGELEEATRAVIRAQEEIGNDGKDEIAQRLWLLRFRIAQERGRCQEAARALETFLARYPSSGYAPPARRSLQELQDGLREGSAQCTG